MGFARVRKSEVQQRLTEGEYQAFSEQFIDAILDPRQPWLIQYILAFGFPPIPTAEQIASGALAAMMREAIDASPFTIEWLYEALKNRDRETLIARFKEIANERGLTRDELSRLLACVDFKTLKMSIKGLSEPFKYRPGPTPPTERQYNEALSGAESLYPVLLKLINQQSTGTKNTIADTLNYLAKDFPKACKFLLDNRFDTA